MLSTENNSRIFLRQQQCTGDIRTCAFCDRRQPKTRGQLFQFRQQQILVDVIESESPVSVVEPSTQFYDLLNTLAVHSCLDIGLLYIAIVQYIAYINFDRITSGRIGQVTPNPILCISSLVIQFTDNRKQCI